MEDDGAVSQINDKIFDWSVPLMMDGIIMFDSYQSRKRYLGKNEFDDYEEEFDELPDLVIN